MTPTALTHAYALVGRALEVFVALQPAATPGGGGGGSSSGGGGGAAAGGGGIMNLVMLPLIFGFVWFFMLRPMQKQQKEQESLQKALRKGDRVVTSSGIIGTVHEVGDKEVSLEIADKVRISVLRDTVSRKYDPAAEAKTSTAEAKK
ncbi:MAG: preprotein translocase subunit YajC [Polyangiales bacterium]